MMIGKAFGLLGALLLGLLAGCSGSNHQDLEAFMAEIRATPVGEIEPLPAFTPYIPFTYSVMAQRSPFDRPMQAIATDAGNERRVAPPDESRVREYLENYNFAALSMVGTLAGEKGMWALVDDGSGGIHRVAVGNYLGKNHGRIVALTASQIEVLEIVPDGKHGWVERPRTLALRER